MVFPQPVSPTSNTGSDASRARPTRVSIRVIAAVHVTLPADACKAGEGRVRRRLSGNPNTARRRFQEGKGMLNDYEIDFGGGGVVEAS